ncbi:rod shape-determining protein MreC [Geomobilimonas luticola]|uniref:Cell shape-determining protein MreC n=1 Tax=Geomobilimonas luticola TaxID=1114878 RepID=A0ABS5SF70_9BACT|nr:rod shape-determining protein MreC [Geomobilimonas luticola]MBT0653998.1 rod shape-determining protein MreC [Geomobilimonas luticola]
MWELLKKYRIHLVTGGIVLLAFLFYSLNLKNREHANLFERFVLNATAPLHGGIAAVNRAVVGVWNDYVALVDVRRENKELRESVKILNGRLLESREALLANERMKKLLDLKNSLPVPALTASVIGEDGAPWFQTLTINRGEADGLQEGMPVVAAEGVVGQVVKVAGNSSRVLLLTDNASSMAGMIQRSRARGVVKGKGSGRCSLEFTLREEDVKVGDTIITSGVGGVFPKGLAVGEVAMVKKGEYGIFQTIEVRPAVNITRLEEVIVLLKQRSD